MADKPKKHFAMIELEVPKGPNFVTVKGLTEAGIDIADLTDDQLRELAKAMGECMVERSAERRASREDHTHD